jgi:hypothetical protein
MMKDWRGVEIHVGDLVVYPGRQGSSMWMVEAEVVELIPGRPNVQVPHGLKVRRLREWGWKGDEIDHKVVSVEAGRVAVVKTAAELNLDRYTDLVEDVQIDGGAT